MLPFLRGAFFYKTKTPVGESCSRNYFRFFVFLAAFFAAFLATFFAFFFIAIVVFKKLVRIKYHACDLPMIRPTVHARSRSHTQCCLIRSLHYRAKKYFRQEKNDKKK